MKMKQTTVIAAPEIRFDNSFAALPARFYAKVEPQPVKAPEILAVNVPLGEQLGLAPDWLAGPEAMAVFAGNRVPEGAQPLAMAYAGHQFGHFVPQLGDGRAVLLGEVIDTDGVRWDVHLKGAGRTPFSRGGDGRAPLGPVLREYLVSEAMHALGIPTTRALAAVATGESVLREEPLPGGVLTRISRSLIRVGHFQYFAAREDVLALAMLADYVIDRLVPAAAEAENPYLALLEHVIATQAQLIAQWQGVGFIHGVMNTDNCSIAGETLDYGPCAFLDGYHPETVFSYIDRMGRYAFGRQPEIGKWNLLQFAGALLPLLARSEDQAVRLAQQAIETYDDQFANAYWDVMGAKLGLSEKREEDQALCRDLLKMMQDDLADYTLTFRLLATAAEGQDDTNGMNDTNAAADLAALEGQFADRNRWRDWLARWRRRLQAEQRPLAVIAEQMRQINPFLIARNHRVEQAIAAAYRGDLRPFEMLHEALKQPFEEKPHLAALAAPPKPHEQVRQTFCGT